MTLKTDICDAEFRNNLLPRSVVPCFSILLSQSTVTVLIHVGSWTGVSPNPTVQLLLFWVLIWRAPVFCSMAVSQYQLPIHCNHMQSSCSVQKELYLSLRSWNVGNGSMWNSIFGTKCVVLSRKLDKHLRTLFPQRIKAAARARDM